MFTHLDAYQALAFSEMLLPYILLSLPGLIAAILIRLWAVHRKWDRSTRAWLFALTIGLLCSPGADVAGYGVGVIVPSIFAIITSGGHSRAVWVVFVVSSMVTTLVTNLAYELVSKPKSGNTDQDGA